MKTKLVPFASVLFLTFGFASQSRSQWVHTNGLNGSLITCLATSGTNVFAGTENQGTMDTGGLFYTNNNGESWISASNALITIYGVQCLAVSGTELYAGVEDSVFVTNNNGATWKARSYANYYNYPDVVSLAVNGSSIFASTLADSVYRSDDDGVSWMAINKGLTNNGLGPLFLSGGNLFGSTHYGVFLSTNGINWDSVNGLQGIDAFAAIGTNLFAGTYGGGVFLSTNSGISWQAVNTGVTPTDDLIVQALVVSGVNLFASIGEDNNSVYLSTNNGTSWQNIDGNGLTFDVVSALGVSGTNLFAGTEGDGVWQRPLSDFGISSVTQTPPSPPQMQSYPNPFSQSTTVTFSSQSAGYAEVTVVNLLGAQVAQLFSGELLAGEHSFPWNPSGMAPGLYECIVRMNGQVQRISMSHLE